MHNNTNQSPKSRIVIGGTGFIGQQLVQHWLKHDIPVIVVGRSTDKINRCFKSSVRAIDWPNFLQNGTSLLAQTDAVINLAGHSLATGRWTKRTKQLITKSRIDTAQALNQLVIPLANQAPLIIQASGVAVYGPKQPSAFEAASAFTETSPLPTLEKIDFLTDMARDWEQQLESARAAGVAVVTLRLAAVLGQQGGIMPALLRAYRLGLGGKIGNGQQLFPWIHITDVLRMIDFLIAYPSPPPHVNAIAPHSIQQLTFAKTLAQCLKRPTLLSLPKRIVQLLFGEMADALLLNGQHVIPQWLTDHDFTFSYPTIQQALLQLTK